MEKKMKKEQAVKGWSSPAMELESLSELKAQRLKSSKNNKKKTTTTNGTGADLGGGCRECAPPPPQMTCGFLVQLVFCPKKTMWLIGVEVEQETSAPTPKKKPGSAPAEPEVNESVLILLSFDYVELITKLHCQCLIFAM